MARFSARQRGVLLQQLKTDWFDVLIVGGGINGAGVLRDLVLRTQRSRPGQPLRLALIEKNHFAISASSKNSQLVHGGLRYLKYLHFSLVAEGLRERATLLAIAPHAVRIIPFLLPVYEAGKRVYYRAGTMLYDLLAGKQNVGRSHWLDPGQTLQREPMLNAQGLRGSILFYDGRMEASRLVFDQLRECVEAGAVVVNSVEALESVRDSEKIVGVRARDAWSGEQFSIRARTVVHTLGPWEKAVPLKLVRGSHLVFRRLTQGHCALASFEDKGRILFVIPYGPEDGFSLVGTTEEVQNLPEPVEMDAGEEHYLRRHLSAILPASSGQPRLGHFSALRPLLSGSRAVTALSRGHRIWKSSANVYHMGGGKYTTFRRMAQELVDLLARDHFPGLGHCLTEREAIDGNRKAVLEDLRKNAEALACDFGASVSTVHFLIDCHGRRAPEVLALCKEPEWRCRVVPELPYLRAQISWCAENEMVLRLQDFLTVSTPLGYLHHFSEEELKELDRHLQ